MNPTTNTEAGAVADVPCEHCGHAASYHVREALQAPYRGLWQALCARVTDTSYDMPIYKRDLDRWIVEIWNEQPEAKAAFALNTTLLGREGEVTNPPS